MSHSGKTVVNGGSYACVGTERVCDIFVLSSLFLWEHFPLEAGGSDSLRRQGATSDREDIESKGSKVEGPAISSGDFRGGCDEVSVFKVMPVFWDKRPVAHSGSSRAMSNTSYCPELGGL